MMQGLAMTQPFHFWRCDQNGSAAADCMAVDAV